MTSKSSILYLENVNTVFVQVEAAEGCQLASLAICHEEVNVLHLKL